VIERVRRHLSGHKTAYGGLALVAILLVGVLIGRQPWNGLRGRREASEFRANGPAEFLYLDRARVIAYLAQMEGGTFNTETLTSKLSNEANGKLALQNVGEIGGASSEENSLARDVTPTAAADYFELLKKLDGQQGLTTIGLGRFKHEVEPMEEGSFVRFQTHGLRPPIYLNPYLAVRQKTTLTTLFPPPSRAGANVGLEEARRQRGRAIHFRHRLGKNPRVVFALRPLDRREIRRRKRGEPARPRSAAMLATHYRRMERRRRRDFTRREEEAMEAKVGAREKEEEEHVLYLMPLNARLLTRERSLIKFGGGEFTVVGKMVRLFPEAGDGHTPAYIDSPTLETWEEPLAHAPLRLLCDTDPECKREEQRPGGLGRTSIDASRRRDLSALREQTEIADRGAVILPIAIYK
jgi:hypothetical protein